jgi:protein-S-isoprenylcysteine O-methyltransferase Ste14
LKLGEILFKIRGYTPIPFLILALIFVKPITYLILLGFFMIIFGEFFRIWGVMYAGAATRTREAGAPELVTNGPFAHVRNPLYIGNIFIYVGAIVMSGAWFPELVFIVFIFFYFQYYFIVLHEESKLEQLFGEIYLNYKKKVPRFFIKFMPYENKSNINPDIKKALRSERSTFIAMAAFLIFVVIRILM